MKLIFQYWYNGTVLYNTNSGVVVVGVVQVCVIFQNYIAIKFWRLELHNNTLSIFCVNLQTGMKSPLQADQYKDGGKWIKRLDNMLWKCKCNASHQLLLQSKQNSNFYDVNIAEAQAWSPVNYSNMWLSMTTQSS